MRVLLTSVVFGAMIMLGQQQPDEENDDFVLMSLFDGDSNGEVSEEQFLNYLGTTEEITNNFENDEWKESGKIAFQVYDNDKNGLLDIGEFSEFERQMNALYQHNTEEEQEGEIL